MRVGLKHERNILLILAEATAARCSSLRSPRNLATSTNLFQNLLRMLMIGGRTSVELQLTPVEIPCHNFGSQFSFFPRKT